ncbi:MAG TPA: glycosyltransferase family 39 protein [Gemmataceae bacterium]|nr:glycosyltransferase family 39 protein [Gemmataceae bacterium]
MNKMPAFTAWTLLGLLLTVSCGAFTRVGYLALCTTHARLAPALLVQGVRTSDHIADNLASEHWFGGAAPLANDDEATAHVAPGFPSVSFAIASLFEPADQALRWFNAGLGILTVACFFLFARRAFHSDLVATLASLLVAVHPFWILNTAELNDGVLASFLLAVCLALGTRAGQGGGAITSLFFGVALAALALVRAAFLPFAVIALLWFLWQCRRLPFGWFAAILALLGFANGLAPWALHNYQVFERPVPIVTSTYWHLWMGNNPHADGTALDETAARDALSEERRKELLVEPNQARRYNMLAQDVWSEIKEHPAETLNRRIRCAIAYLLGGRWLKDGHLVQVQEHSETVAAPPDWLRNHVDTTLAGSLLAMLLLAFLGWRWSYPWRREGRLAAIALLWLPLPYLLSHAEALSGPRLPLDGVLLCFAAYALLCLIPGAVRRPEQANKPT